MAKDRKHHFVPVCYLNHFKQDGHIHSYSKKRGNEYVCGVDAVCELPYFYKITQESWWSTFEIEKDFFCKNVESPLGPMITKIEQSIKSSLPDDSSKAKIILNEETRRSIASMIFAIFSFATFLDSGCGYANNSTVSVSQVKYTSPSILKNLVNTLTKA